MKLSQTICVVGFALLSLFMFIIFSTLLQGIARIAAIKKAVYISRNTIVVSYLRMRKFFFLSVFLFSILLGNSQSVFNHFTYGKLVSENDTLVGFFQFETGLSSMGQRIHYKESKEKVFSKPLWAKDFHYFESDSIYLATCDISTITGDIFVMLPRVINGTLQVFEYTFKGGPMSLIKMEQYYFVRSEYANSKVTKKNFKKVMPYLIPDSPELLSRIERGELKFKDLKTIIIQFNAETAKK
jgi:hypothetical protein